MALTKVSTDGVKDDAITKSKIPANQIEASELANNAVDTNAIQDEAVTLAKLPHGTSSNDGKFLRANNGADPTFETVSTDLVGDTSPQLGGDLQSNGNNILVADNDVLVCGSGTDLKIFHDGSHSFIRDQGTGTLRIEASEVGILSADGSETMAQFVQNGAASLRYDNSTKFVTTSTGARLNGDLVINDGNQLQLQNSVANRSSEIVNTGSSGNSTISLKTNGSQRMLINSSGRVGINVTAPDKMLEINNSGSTNYSTCLIHASGSDNVRVVGLRSSRASGGTNADMIEFFNSSGSKVGNIQSNGSSTSYNTSSDYRLKENVTPISDGITRLKTLKPSRFNFKDTKDITVDGFLAHEVTAVPEAVTGTKDQVATADDVSNEIKEGDPIYQGIDQSKLVPLLTAALQEAITKIEVLETKVAALEAG